MEYAWGRDRVEGFVDEDLCDLLVVRRWENGEWGFSFSRDFFSEIAFGFF